MWVSRELHRGRGLLALPAGTLRVDHLPVAGLEGNGLGAFRISEGPGLIDYRVIYRPGGARDSPPDPRRDRAVPRNLRPLMERLVAGLGLAGQPPERVLAAVAGYFEKGFRYSLDPRARAAGRGAIERFLTETRAGHCEYFATATVLLLRAAGVPARYATGYALAEYSPLEEAWLVRRRHAHSWARAWVGGAWVDLDTTPEVWAAIEARGAPWWRRLYDLGSWLRYRFERWRQAPGEEGSQAIYFWLAGALALVLVWRLGRVRRVALDRGGPQAAPGARPGGDSELYRVEAWLAERGERRAPGEPLGRWLRRLAREGVIDDPGPLTGPLVEAHYRYRFAPRGLDAGERRRLREGVAGWLARRGARLAERAGAGKSR